MPHLNLCFLLLSLLLQSPVTSQGSGISVIEFKWSRDRQVVEFQPQPETTPARALIPVNKNYARNSRINESRGARDPNLDTVDGRSAALEKAVQESRSPKQKPVEGFLYVAKLKNTTEKAIDIIFWEYQSSDPANTGPVTRRQFLCGVSVPGGKQKDVRAFSVSGPSDVVDVDTLANAKGKYSALNEKVVINRVEFTDGSIWQRKDWDFAEIRHTYKRAVDTPWGKEMCRQL